ncbi:MAG: radical SAM protein [Patescibacteria group bacterium]
MNLPNTITFELTHKCNCRCEMCRFWIPESTKADYKELNFTKIIEIINKIKYYYDKKKNNLILGLTGGEPFLKKDFIKIINFLSKKRIKYDIVTNFSVPTKEVLDSFAKYPPIKLNISLDGLGETHNLIRKRKIFNKIILNIKYFRKISPHTPIKINSTINKYNVYELEKLVYFVIKNRFELNFQHLNFITPWLLKEQRNFEQIHFGKTFFHEPTFYTLNQKEVKILQKKIEEVNQIRYKKNYNVTFLPELVNNLSVWYLDPKNIVTTQKCDINRLRIKPDGRIVHCENFVYGNLVKSDFEKIYNSIEAKKFKDIISRKIMPFCNRCCLRFKSYSEN